MTRRTLEKRDIPAALLAGFRWLRNPVSQGGAKQVPRIQMLARGPEILADVERMRAHPTGKKLLAERRDLGVFLSNSAALKAMPEASLGRTFYDAMDNPVGVPGYLLAGLIYKDGFFDSFDMSDDARFYLERIRWLHDLFHVVSGYATDLAGEGMLIYFQHAYLYGLNFNALARSPFGIGPRYFLRPDCGKARWQEYLCDANSRGLHAYSVSQRCLRHGKNYYRNRLATSDVNLVLCRSSRIARAGSIRVSLAKGHQQGSARSRAKQSKHSWRVKWLRLVSTIAIFTGSVTKKRAACTF